LNVEKKVKESLELLSLNWKIEKPIYDLHLGKRSDIVDTSITIDKVIFHIPTLQSEGLFVLWKCLWPDCHNCCERQGRLPLTKDDIARIGQTLGYKSEAEFIKNETVISSWDDVSNNLITTITMISLKREQDETNEQDGTPLRCRFLNSEGECKIHPNKPGVCWLYPFASWSTSDKGRLTVHATFQFTGDCPGFYTSNSLDSIMPVLQEYSKKIYDYTMAVNRTTREKYGAISILEMHG
jgi:uncharacterized protein